MSTVRIPPVLRKQTGGEKEVQADGTTVGEVLKTLAQSYPSLQSQLFDGGQLQRYVNVYLNDQDIQYMDRLETPASADDTIVILPAMAGGSGHDSA